MLVFPNAKINIGLNIVEKRSDGYHNIESCFYPIGWSDALEITLSEAFSLETDGVPIPESSADNLCKMAYDMLADDYELPAVKMHLLKAIPIGAGLGGGSSDAAFAIRALNELFELNISVDKQLSYARRLGSDCAFFILNKPAYCFQKGDLFEEIDLKLTGKWIVLINPGIHISTVEAYSGINPQAATTNLRDDLKGPVSDWSGHIKNDFEATLFPKYPLLKEIKQQLYNDGAEYASMSGSGSTLYGIFDQQKNLNNYSKNYKVWQGLLP